MSTILIHGIDTLLGSYIAARWLQTAEHRVVYGDNITEDYAISLVSGAAEQIRGEQALLDGAEMRSRLKSCNGCDESLATLSYIWFFDNGRRTNSETESFERLIGASRDQVTAVLNYVIDDRPRTASHGSKEVKSACPENDTRTAPRERVTEFCSRRGLAIRVFTVPLILGTAAPSLRSPDPFDFLLYSLHSFKAEIEERSQQYFDFHALRCVAAPCATLNVLPVTEASETLMHACRLEMDGDTVLIEGYDVPFSSICDRISATFGLSVLPVEDREALNAVDRTFAARIGCIETYLNSPQPQITEASGKRRIFPQHSDFSEEAQLECFETIRKKLDRVAAARSQRVAELPSKLATRVVERSGSELTYYVAGAAGPTIVVLNALGQGLEYWYRLMETLVPSYQVIIWEPRGTTCPPPFGLADQVDDLEAVLKNEGIESCHVVCWCTSPKVAIDFHLRRPSVFRSMIFLNSTFKCDGGHEEFDTAYEKNLFSLCRMLVRKPTMAASVMKTFQSRTEPEELEILELEDSEQMSVSVLSMMSAGLRSHVLGPFKTEETTLNYAHQMMDFWANDCRSKAAGITVPVLLIGAEYDQIISPLSSKFGTGLFPNAWYLCMAGATHYFLYDRAEMLAQIVTTFIHNPEKVPGAHRKQPLIAQVS